MNKAIWILIDAVILFAVSTVFVLLANWVFSGLKGKTPKDDPIVAAITKGDIKELEVMATSGEKSAGQSDSHGRTALMRAAYVNYSGDALLAEANEKRAAIIALLLEHNAPINQQDHDGWTALMWASWSNMPKVVEELIKRGAINTFADHQGNTALTIAARRGNVEIVRLLINNGADKSVTTHLGKTALDQAHAGLSEYPEKNKSYQTIISLFGGS